MSITLIRSLVYPNYAVIDKVIGQLKENTCFVRRIGLEASYNRLMPPLNLFCNFICLLRMSIQFFFV